MARTTWIVLDMNYLCYRAFFSMGNLSWQEEPTGVIFGVMKDIEKLQEEIGSTEMVYCFDHGKGLREQAYPWYKETRRKRKLDEEQYSNLEKFRSQVEKLKMEYLDKMGFGNIFFQKGYEADDIIASVVNQLDNNEKAVIVSADKDLYQLLSNRVSIFGPQTKIRTTKEMFVREYGIFPREWPRVKAIAGCSTDDIPGIRGVGEKTAALFLNGGMSKTHSKYKEIKKFCASPDYIRNLSLVRLPYAGTNNYVPVEDTQNTQKRWNAIAERLGMKSLVNGDSARGTSLED